MTKILIEVKEGMVTGVCSNKENVKIVIVDHDAIQVGQSPVSPDVLSPDTISENLYELYNDSIDPQEIEIREELKRLKF